MTGLLKIHYDYLRVFYVHLKFIGGKFMSITLLGVFAGLLTSCSFIPQAYKVIKTNRTQDISLPMYSLCTIGVFIWIIYGLMINDLAVLLTNIITFVPTCIILILTLKNHIQNKQKYNN